MKGYKALQKAADFYLLPPFLIFCTSLSFLPCCSSFHILSLSLPAYSSDVLFCILNSFLCFVFFSSSKASLWTEGEWVHVHVCALAQVLITVHSARAPGSHCRSAHAQSASSAVNKDSVIILLNDWNTDALHWSVFFFFILHIYS